MKMKKFSFLSMAFTALLLCAATACSSDDNNGNNGGDGEETRNWSTDGGLNAADNLLFNGTTIGNGDAQFVFKGKQTLKKGTYTLKGWVYIADGSELTIEPGTVIKGDKATKSAIIVERGGKIFAQGTQSEPIVFTSGEAVGSRKPGDWGGIILCGKAKHNGNEAQIEGGPRSFHGGNDNADNSGILTYVRIEFAGNPFKDNQEINGLTMGSVGSGTIINHIQVSYCNDDAYEWFGGTVNCSHLVSYKTWDDDFDTDNGFSGKVQFCLAIRDPRIADTSKSNGFESDNNSSGSTAEPYTNAVFSNVTFIGPIASDANFQNTSDYINAGNYRPNNTSALGLFQSAMQIRRNSRLCCFNSIAVGYPIGLILDNQRGNTQEAASNGYIKLQNIWFADMEILGSDANGQYKDLFVSGYGTDEKPIYAENEIRESFSSTFFKTASFNNKVVSKSEMGLTDPAGIGVAYCGGTALNGKASFSDAMVSTGFAQVSYIGAVNTSDNWLNGWTEFDPQNKAY